MDNFDIGKAVRDAIDESLRRRGRANVLLAGRSGVGKSTLINAVFGHKLAETGQGRPVTSTTREYAKEGVAVTLFDTRGLEMDRYGETLAELERFTRERGSSLDPNQHIHLAWVCLAEDSRRVEEGESRTVSTLAKHMPVIGVITKARCDDGFREVVQDLLPEARGVVRVRARGQVDDDGHRLEPSGLQELVDLSMELIPEGQRDALAAAQRVSLKQKQVRAQMIVGSAAIAAGAIGVAPIPFSDAIAIVPIQISMLAGISGVFGLEVSTAFISTLASAAFTAVAATLSGRTIVAGLLKLVPGANIIGGVIAGASAASITTVFGEAYIGTLSALIDTGSKFPASEQVIEAFVDKIKNKRA
jgi:uncharacterized protein (DUF697 family)/GTP-binding protein EngB required for normal cell division